MSAAVPCFPVGILSEPVCRRIDTTEKTTNGYNNINKNWREETKGRYNERNLKIHWVDDQAYRPGGEEMREIIKAFATLNNSVEYFRLFKKADRFHRWVSKDNGEIEEATTTTSSSSTTAATMQPNSVIIVHWGEFQGTLPSIQRLASKGYLLGVVITSRLPGERSKASLWASVNATFGKDALGKLPICVADCGVEVYYRLEVIKNLMIHR